MYAFCPKKKHIQKYANSFIFQIHRCIEFSQNVGWKMMVIIALEKMNLDFEIFFESGFLEGNHFLKWPCSIYNDS